MIRRVVNWIDERSGIQGVLNGFLNRGVPRGVGWFYILGSATMLTLVIQVVTGLALTLYYVPSTDQAYESVRYITHDVLFGGFIRGLHHWSASAFVLLLVLHLLRVLFFGAFKYPRELNWLIGVGLFFVGLGLALSGYLLPWDQRAYWGAVVSTEAAGTIPLIGPFLLRAARGGAEVGAVTLTRFFSLHIMWLPVIVAALVGAHLYMVVRQGISNPPERSVKVPTDPQGYAAFYGERKKGGHTFYPEVIFKDTVAFLVIFTVLALLAIFVGAPLEPKADPTVIDYIPRPEWYFLFFFQFLRLLKPEWEIVGTTVVPLVAVAALVLLPFLDRNRYRHSMDRPFVAGIAALTVVGLVLLSVQGALAPTPESAAVARLEIQSLTPIEEQGRGVYRQFACSVCHQMNGAGGGTRGPDLAGVGAQLEPQQVLSHLQPITGTSAMPTYGIDNRDLLALTAYLLTLTNPPTAPVSPTVALPRGEEVYMANGCAACHAIDGAGGAIGPDLSGEGARHDADWLIQFLQNPAVVVPGTKMPAHPLPPADAQSVADYLASLKGAAAAPSVEAGKNLYDNQGCAVCHVIQDKGGSAGPDLTRVGDQRDAATLAQYIHDPKSIYPKTAMPPYGNLSEVQLQSMALYMLALVGKAPTPAPVTPATAAAATPAPATPPVAVTAPSVATVAGSAPLTPTAAAVSDAATLYATNCAACHGDKGQGGAVFKAPISLLNQTDEQVAAFTNKGQGSMPPFSGRLSATDMSALIKLMRSWGPPAPARAAPATAVAPATATAVAPAPVMTATATAVTPSPADGAALFAASCAGCHGATGQGGALVKEAIDLTAQPDAQVAALISKGRGAMPGYGQLSDVEVAALIAAMRGWKAPAAAPSAAAVPATITTTVVAAAPDGAALFAASCAGCHGATGQGGALVKEAIDLTAQPDAQVAALISKGRGAMPGHGQLSDVEVAALIAAMRGWKAPAAAPATAALPATITATVAVTTTLAAAAPDGAALFVANCAGCHGDKGRGGAVVKEAIELEERSDATLRMLIQQGRRSMPGFAQLSAAELDALIAAMRSWNQ